ncbi:hypothetical protein SAMN06269185_1427 [Natronoarchaeum philippinense]|uniref:Uncharacterized protein n=1 Tax=Natronoarchaeum philippinense TaxID=558529 RepID=A0A285NW95_NATPI|nr:hypothetical protein [Natronoarchaeum philippinense]SNZ11911.1 hypothetical protein SAMN06269185_1427 [Natronoarchaeum philippinense]
MRRRTLLAAATTGLAASAGCLEALGIQTSGVVVTKQVWGRIDPERTDAEGPVATWLLDDGELSADLPEEDAPLPTELPIQIDGEAAAYLDANHGPYDLTANICESPGDPDGDCSGPTVERETFNDVRLGEQATIHTL